MAYRLVDAYLFPLDHRTIVTLAPGSGFAWFGFMPAICTIIGTASFAAGLGLTVDVILDRDAAAYGGIYLGCLGPLTLFTVAVGIW